MPNRIRILIVDDHPMVLKGLSASIDPEPDMEVVASACSGPEAVRLFRDKLPDVTIMDLTLTRQMTGVQAIEAIRREFPEARIIVLSAHKGEEDIFQALKAGATAYLFKESVTSELVGAIRQVHAGGGPIPPDVGRKLADRVGQTILTQREIDVLQLAALGKRNKEIGARLCLAEQTVEGHIKHIHAKLKVHDRTEAVTVALRRGIIRLPE